MSMSSIGASPPVKAQEKSQDIAVAASAPDPKSNKDADDARDRASQPPVQAALPPGQGTRINLLV